MSIHKKIEAHRRELRRAGYNHYLRTGRVPVEIKSALGEDIAGGYWVKFNPYHDPENGQFTFAPGHPNAISNPVISGKHNITPVTIRPSHESSNRAAESEIQPRPYLSSVHNEIRSIAMQHPPEKGTREWTTIDLIAWLGGGKDIFDFKDQWVHGYRHAIQAAAERYDLPPELIAGVAYIEVGGDPLIIDNLAYALRNEENRDRTSFGNVSIQVRRAADTLGYDMSQDLSPSQRRAIVNALENPQTNIFVAAKHLSDLRDIDFRGVSGSQLDRPQIEAIATRYNSGPDISLSEIKKNMDYGHDLTKRWGRMRRLLQ